MLPPTGDAFSSPSPTRISTPASAEPCGKDSFSKAVRQLLSDADADKKPSSPEIPSDAGATAVFAFVLPSDTDTETDTDPDAVLAEIPVTVAAAPELPPKLFVDETPATPVEPTPTVETSASASRSHQTALHPEMAGAGNTSGSFSSTTESASDRPVPPMQGPAMDTEKNPVDITAMMPPEEASGKDNLSVMSHFKKEPEYSDAPVASVGNRPSAADRQLPSGSFVLEAEGEETDQSGKPEQKSNFLFHQEKAGIPHSDTVRPDAASRSPKTDTASRSPQSEATPHSPKPDAASASSQPEGMFHLPEPDTASRSLQPDAASPSPQPETAFRPTASLMDGAAKHTAFTSSSQNASAAASGDEPTMSQKAVMDQIVERAVIRSTSERSEVRIQLKPEFLGDVRMAITSENSQLSIKLLTDQIVTKEILESQMHHLRAEFDRQGLVVNKIEVSVQTENDPRLDDRSSFFQMAEDQSGNSRREANGKARYAHAHTPAVLLADEMAAAQKAPDISKGISYFA
ncbi:flagellar hook-length control protein FliK [Desulfosarcina sp. OttesenSCG-928-G10]|nr:flagellar hook-length control protein FliK [Desulfosarcina sp. OttesenSCG-928-G10]